MANSKRLAVLLGMACGLLFTQNVTAQYKADHLPGFTGLQPGTQAPPGLYVGDLLYVYPTSTIKDNNGNKINHDGSITSVLDGIVVATTTNFKFLHGNYGTQVVLPFVKNRLQYNSFDSNPSMAFTDMIYSPVVLGWHFKRADANFLYNIYMPTGRFKAGATDNTGMGMWAHELAGGTTVYLDSKRTWHAGAMFSSEFNTQKSGEDLKVGTTGTVEWGVGKTLYKKVGGPIPMITNLGVVGYSQFKMSNDSGTAIPLLLRGLKDNVSAIGPEINTFIPKPRLSLLFRYEPEYTAKNRTQGQMFLFSITWAAKSFAHHP